MENMKPTTKSSFGNCGKSICIVVTDAVSFHLCRHQFRYLLNNGFRVTAVASAGPNHDLFRKQGVYTVAIPMKRNPSVFNDIVSFFRMLAFFAFNRFDLVCVSTPKASLLAGIAAKFTLQPKIMFIIRGRTYENKSGISRKAYEMVDKIICMLSDTVFCISKEIMADFIKKKLCHKNKIFVIGSGSSNGVDLKAFSLTKEFVAKGQEIRKNLGIGQDDVCILFSGRVRREKGINELVKAFKKIYLTNQNVHLILQGRYEKQDPLDSDTVNLIEHHPHIHKADWCSEIQQYYAAADIFAFPSYREGFGNVALEAAAMKLPVVAFNVIGVREAVTHGENGILCDFGNINQLAEALLKLINDKDLRITYGESGRKRCEKEFNSDQITNTIVNVYNTLIHEGIASIAKIPNCHFIK